MVVVVIFAVVQEQTEMKKLCFMCLKEDWFMREVNDIWRIHGMAYICESCGDKADRFIDYYGKKKEKDKRKLKAYLNTGVMVQNKYSAQINAGYY